MKPGAFGAMAAIQNVRSHWRRESSRDNGLTEPCRHRYRGDGKSGRNSRIVPSIYSIGHTKRWPGPFPLQDGSLLVEGKEFCVGRRTIYEDLAEDGGEGFDDLMPWPAPD